MPYSRFCRPVTVGLVLLLGLGCARADSGLTLVAPETFSDVREVRDLQRNLQTPLDALIRSLAQRHLPAGQSLNVELTDVDLAGEIEPVGPQAMFVRVLRSSTWPRLTLRYTLRDAAGQVLSLGENRLSDMNYLNRPGALDRPDRLPYEQAMLTDWFLQTFVAPPSASPAASH